ncbi:MAG: AAA family ATPase [Dehalococcoidia bacterium]|nr:AAA family ATPase [Dehalococcoidia bacterium]
MFKQLRIKNFKSLADTVDLAIKPLTILVGHNSSGKSALFKALLALKQTAESRDTQSPLVVNGDYVELGSYGDFIYGHDLSRGFSIKAGLSGDNLFSDIVQRALNSSYKASEVPSHSDDIGFEVKFQYNQRTRQILVKTVEATGKSKYLLRADRSRKGVYKAKTPLSSGNIVLNKFYLLRPEELPDFESLSEAQLAEMKMSLIHFLLLTGFGQFIQQSLGRTHYLGPLRAAPERFYIAGGETPQDVGLAGERAIDVLRMHSRLTGSSDESRKLVGNVEEWVKRFGFSLEVKFSQASSTVYEVLFIDPHTNIPVNIADVGFGASQVLPVVVQGFYSPPGSTFLIEQPEIHLHPKAQATLGDLLVELSKQDRQVIVETHSEHIINRVQLRIADETIDRSDVAIYYFESTEQGTKIKEVDLTEYGQYVNETLPKDFFDENYTESYSLSKAIIARKKREEKPAKAR